MVVTILAIETLFVSDNAGALNAFGLVAFRTFYARHICGFWARNSIGSGIVN